MPTLLSLTAIAAAVQATTALVLKDLPHNDGLRYSKRGDPLGCLDLKSQETFLWGAADENQAALGNLTVFMPDVQENILSMDRFTDMLSSITCTQTTIDLTFRDDDTFAYAQAVWDRVNGDANDTFVMVAGTGACGWNTDTRQPFRVTTLAFDEAANTAYLAAEALDWAQAIHTYSLNVGGLPSIGLQKRGFGEIEYNKDLNIDFNHQFPIDTVSLPMPDGVTATLDLSNCSTSGAFAFQFSLETFFLVPRKAEMSVHPQDVALTMAPSLKSAGSTSAPRTAALELARIQLAGIKIPLGILDIGPNVVLSVGATVGPLQGQVTVEAGVVYSLSNDAVASVDAIGFEAQQTGWTPTVQTTPLTVQAELDGTVKVFLKAELELTAKAFGIGFDLGVGLAPYLAADLNTVTAASGSCGASDGLAVSPSYGVDLILDAHTPFNGADDPLFEITLFSLDQPLPGTCLPFVNVNVVPAHISEAPSTSSISLSPTALPAIVSSSSAVLVSSIAASASASSSALSAHVYTATSSSLASASPLLSSLPSVFPVATSAGVHGYGYTAVSSSTEVASYSSLSTKPGLSSSSAEVQVYGYVPASTFSTTPSSSSILAVPTVSATPQYGGYGYGSGKYGYGGY